MAAGCPGLVETAPLLRETALQPAVPALVQAQPPNAITQSREPVDEMRDKAPDLAGWRWVEEEPLETVELGAAIFRGQPAGQHMPFSQWPLCSSQLRRPVTDVEPQRRFGPLRRILVRPRGGTR